MPPLPHQQCVPYGQGDTRLPTFVRFRDLVDANIVRNWPTLLRLIDEEGFPPGAMLGRNTRAWALDEVEAWLADPTARKAVPRRKQQHDDAPRESLRRWLRIALRVLAMKKN
jgi:Prophage CP4-57 regulatory protein (AlpA)